MSIFNTDKNLVKQLVSLQNRVIYLERQITEKDRVIAKQLETINNLEDRNSTSLKSYQRLQLDKIRPKKNTEPRHPEADFMQIVKNIDEKLDLVAVPPRKYFTRKYFK